MRGRDLLLVLLIGCQPNQDPTVETAGEDLSLPTELPLPPEPADTCGPPPPLPEGIENYSAVLGSYETKYQSVVKRGKNIERAVFSSLRIYPGEVFSFNETVGPRTMDRGFVLAPILLNGEEEKGVGGGVCQVSSTIFAAALLARLEIVERIPHSRYSKYMPPGLDATVNLPEKCAEGCTSYDLRIRNNREFPVLLTLEQDYPKKKWGETVLRAVFRGKEALPVPKYEYDVRKKGDFEKKTREIKGQPPTYVHRKQKGRIGTRVFSRLVLDGQVLTQYESVYPPTDEIWEVGEGWTSDQMPWEEPAPPDAGPQGGGEG